MKKTWVVRLAFKNLLRYKRRTLITAGAIAFGLTMYIWIDSILAGAAEESVRNLRWYETADAMVAGPGYMNDRDSLPLGNSFAWKNLASELEAAGADVTPRISFGADMVFFRDPYPEDGNIPARVIAIDPERDRDVFRLKDTLGEGRWLLEGEDGALVNIPLVKYGLDYSALMRDSNFEYRTTGIFYGSWYLQGFFYALILGVGLSVLVAAVSTRRILRLDIPSSLRFN